MRLFDKMEHIRRDRGGVAVALIDPDTKNDEILLSMINLINECDFDIIFVGGSLISDNEFDRRLEFIKHNTNLPLVIFPGSSNQLSAHADAILYLSLISGRNPQYLIGEHVKSAPLIYNLSIETIATAYILLESGVRSSVEVVSDTKPIPMEKHDIILAHALAGQYLGKSLIFLESGSGAKDHATCEIVSYLKPHLNIPIIVGGGVNTAESADLLVKSGADYIVTGSQIENLPSSTELIQFTQAIHQG